MEIKKNIKQKMEIITDIICDSCGKSCKIGKSKIGNFEFMTLSAQWGYDSKKDLQNWDAHICEKCVDEKLSFIKFTKNVEFL